MNAHIGADADSGLVHPITVTAANEADVEQIEELLHGKEDVVHADAGYSGAQTSVERQGLRREIAAKPGRIKAMKEGRNKRALGRIEKRKASIRAKVKHPFRVIKHCVRSSRNEATMPHETAPTIQNRRSIHCKNTSDRRGPAGDLLRSP